MLRRFRQFLVLLLTGLAPFCAVLSLLGSVSVVVVDPEAAAEETAEAAMSAPARRLRLRDVEPSRHEQVCERGPLAASLAARASRSVPAGHRLANGLRAPLLT